VPNLWRSNLVNSVTWASSIRKRRWVQPWSGGGALGMELVGLVAVIDRGLPGVAGNCGIAVRSRSPSFQPTECRRAGDQPGRPGHQDPRSPRLGVGRSQGPSAVLVGQRGDRRQDFDVIGHRVTPGSVGPQLRSQWLASIVARAVS
jgi:hypothetical protein